MYIIDFSSFSVANNIRDQPDVSGRGIKIKTESAGENWPEFADNRQKNRI